MRLFLGFGFLGLIAFLLLIGAGFAYVALAKYVLGFATTESFHLDISVTFNTFDNLGHSFHFFYLSKGARSLKKAHL